MVEGRISALGAGDKAAPASRGGRGKGGVRRVSNAPRQGRWYLMLRPVVEATRGLEAASRRACKDAVDPRYEIRAEAISRYSVPAKTVSLGVLLTAVLLSCHNRVPKTFCYRLMR